MKKIALLFYVLSISACQSLPERIIIAPNYTAVTQLKLANNIDLLVRDNRETPTALRILQKGDVTKVSSNDLEYSLNIALSKAFKNGDININSSSQNKMILLIHQLEVIVKQQTLKYRSEGIIELEVKLNKGKRSFNKYYNGSQNSEGPLIFDKAKVEGRLNTLLEQMISRIVNDAELQEFLQG
ncbi:YajG family lipoprotein [Pseudoalteromonas sp. NBT06-2]|uniref:YajG family lipoprotein n=1 Tax=Pseudoalteromonas sp. NBT06-2 TaxID=2025950 RepID=UPI001483342C|nr:YajG family lipoprotein [Pseudoalteromonas sp. NBT06-2]